MKLAIALLVGLCVLLIIPSTRDGLFNTFGDMLSSSQEHSRDAVRGSLGFH